MADPRSSVKVQVVISTHGKRIYALEGLLRSLPADTPVLIIHQGFGSIIDHSGIFRKWPNVEVVTSNDTGLAKSRNLGLLHATGDILLPTDDDVKFDAGALSIVERAFAERPDADAITFQISLPDGQPYKTYRRHSHVHSPFTIARVSSIEIALRRKSVLDHAVRWDERFGLKARFAGGLELAFMRNLLTAGCKAYYVPVPIVVHGYESTGRAHTVESGRFRGAAYAKLYGWASLAILPLFAAKNAWRTGSLGRALQYTRNLFKGALELLRD